LGGAWVYYAPYQWGDVALMGGGPYNFIKPLVLLLYYPALPEGVWGVWFGVGGG
jgi:hypothetical protein